MFSVNENVTSEIDHKVCVLTQRWIVCEVFKHLNIFNIQILFITQGGVDN